MSVGELDVLHFGYLVGKITRSSDGRLHFTYDREWLDAENGFALSPQLPLVGDSVETPFFRNLLPEAAARDGIASAAGISADNDFEFLRMFGADCAGSLQIIDPDAPPTVPTEDDVHFLTEADGARLNSSFGFARFFRREGRLRLSLAGAQNKLAVIRVGNRIGLPLDGRPSTHILKLPNPIFNGLVENEAATLATARALGLPVVNHEVITLGETPLLLVERYDRQQQNGAVVRLHQQDLCQAMGLPPDTKYEGEGGPTLVDVFGVTRQEVASPLNSSLDLIAWVAFNVLAHNADAHAKNVSLLRLEDGTQTLTPFYDLVCTGAYDSLDHKLAMSIGGQRDPGAVGKKAWTQFASDVDIGKALVLDAVEHMASILADAFEQEVAALAAQLEAFPRHEQLLRTVRRRAKKAAALL